MDLHSSEPKFQKIFRELEREIISGKYSGSGRLPSESQLVKRYGVSRQTVAHALRDLQNAGVIERRPGAGSFLTRNEPGAVRNDSRDHPPHLLALLIPMRGVAELFQAICGELAGLCGAKNCSLIWGGSGSSIETSREIRMEEADEICDEYIERSVKGVFFTPFELRANTEGVNERIAERLRKAGIAVILLDRDFRDYPFRSDFDLAGIDNFAAGFLLAEHLLKLGQRRLGFVAQRFSAATVPARIAGAQEALRRAEITPEKDFARFGNPEDPAFVRLLTAGKPLEAVICANDGTAALLLNSLAKLKIRVPEELRVVGFDDLRTAKVVREPLTTINQSYRDIADTAMTAMLRRIATPTAPAIAFLVSPKLTIRSSCGAYLRRPRTD